MPLTNTMSDPNNLRVEISGDNATGRSLVASIVAEALEDAGFGEVNVENDLGDAVTEFEDVEKDCEALMQIRPEFFAAPVTVRTIARPDEPPPDLLDETGDEDETGQPEDLTALAGDDMSDED